MPRYLAHCSAAGSVRKRFRGGASLWSEYEAQRITDLPYPRSSEVDTFAILQQHAATAGVDNEETSRGASPAFAVAVTERFIQTDE